MTREESGQSSRASSITVFKNDENDHNEITDTTNTNMDEAQKPSQDRDVEAVVKAKKRKEIEIQDQSSRLPPKQLAIVCISMVCAIMLGSLEQTGVSTTLPAIEKSLNTGQSISWVGTSYLVANTASQAFYGRLSDIFGRKAMLLVSIGLFAIGNLLCGFAKSLAELIVFRAIAGIGGGGLFVLSVIILSDVTSLRERGKVQGYMGVGTVIGFTVGPVLGGVFAENNWRWVFWYTVPPAVLSMIQIVIWLPLKHVSGSSKEKIKMIDYAGAFTQLVSVIFILVPISGGGSSYPWSSPLVIVLLVLGGIFAVLFILVEKYFAKLPLIPLRLFRNRSFSFLVLNSFLTGCYMQTALYFMPIYFQLIRGSSPIHSSLLLMSMTVSQLSTVLIAGFLVSKTGRYNYILWTGYSLFCIGAGLVTRFDRTTSTGYMVGILLIEGLGLGLTLQTSLVAMQAHAPHPDRAVVSSIRNLVRYIGGAFGLAIASSLLSNLSSQYIRQRDPSLVAQSDVLVLPEGLTPEQRNIMLDGYMKAFKAIFYFLLATGLSVSMLGFTVKEIKLREDPKKVEINEENNEKSAKDVATGAVDTAVIADIGSSIQSNVKDERAEAILEEEEKTLSSRESQNFNPQQDFKEDS